MNKNTLIIIPQKSTLSWVYSDFMSIYVQELLQPILKENAFFFKEKSQSTIGENEILYSQNSFYTDLFKTVKSKEIKNLVFVFPFYKMSFPVYIFLSFLKYFYNFKILIFTDTQTPSSFFNKFFTRNWIEKADKIICSSALAYRDLKAKNKHKMDFIIPSYQLNFLENIIKLTESNSCKGIKRVLFLWDENDAKQLDFLKKIVVNKKFEMFGIKLNIVFKNEEMFAKFKKWKEEKKFFYEVFHFSHLDDIKAGLITCQCVAILSLQPLPNSLLSLVYASQKLVVSNNSAQFYKLKHEVNGYLVEDDPIKFSDAIFRYFSDLQAFKMKENIVDKDDDIKLGKILEEFFT